MPVFANIQRIVPVRVGAVARLLCDHPRGYRRSDNAADGLASVSPHYSESGRKVRVLASVAMGQELTSTGVPTGIERQKRLVRYCRGYVRPSACVVPLNWP
jgi:hypothetical protein